jgi:proteasome lid subunit RPN8/RPN11
MSCMYCGHELSVFEKTPVKQRLVESRAVEISRPCLNTMVSSALEVYPLETFGLVAGITANDRIQCLAAQVVQLAERTQGTVIPHSAMRLRQLMQEVARTRSVGSFHSHPQPPESNLRGAPYPSPSDISSMESSGDIVNFILAVNETKQIDHDFVHAPPHRFLLENAEPVILQNLLEGTLDGKSVEITCFSISPQGVLVADVPIDIGSSYVPKTCSRCGALLPSESRICPYCEGTQT